MCWLGKLERMGLGREVTAAAGGGRVAVAGYHDHLCSPRTPPLPLSNLAECVSPDVRSGHVMYEATWLLQPGVAGTPVYSSCPIDHSLRNQEPQGQLYNPAARPAAPERARQLCNPAARRPPRSSHDAASSLARHRRPRHRRIIVYITASVVPSSAPSAPSVAFSVPSLPSPISSPASRFRHRLHRLCHRNVTFITTPAGTN